MRSSAKIQKNIIDSYDSQKEFYLCEIRNEVDKAHSILMNSSSTDEMVRDFGLLLNQTWTKKKMLSNHISNNHIDQIYQLGIDAGAYGGKLCGAGTSGFVVFIVPENKKLSVLNALHNYKNIDIKFEKLGTHIIYKKT